MSAPTEHTAAARSRRHRSEVWSLISRPQSWPAWNAAVQELELDGPFTTGTRGRLRSREGSRLSFLVVDVEPVSQHSELVGPAATHFAQAFGRALVSGVESTVAALAAAPTSDTDA